MRNNAAATALPAGETAIEQEAVFNKDAVSQELREAALVARLDRHAPALTSIVEDVSKLAMSSIGCGSTVSRRTPATP
jgi:hypothetical protein